MVPVECSGIKEVASVEERQPSSAERRLDNLMAEGWDVFSLSVCLLTCEGTCSELEVPGGDVSPHPAAAELRKELTPGPCVHSLPDRERDPLTPQGWAELLPQCCQGLLC